MPGSNPVIHPEEYIMAIFKKGNVNAKNEIQNEKQFPFPEVPNPFIKSQENDDGTFDKKLLPCPFCGKKACLYKSSSFAGGFQIMCSYGCIRSKKFYREEDGLKMWNIRINKKLKRKDSSIGRTEG